MRFVTARNSKGPGLEKPTENEECLARLRSRRRFIRQAAAGSTLAVLGGLYIFEDQASFAAGNEMRADGKRRLPPGQRILKALKPMGGQPGSALRKDFKLRVHGLVDKPFEVDFAGLEAIGSIEKALDVHCVTGWSRLGAKFRGVPLLAIAKRAGVDSSARHVIFESAHGYTANIPLKEALHPEVMLAYELEGAPFRRRHGAPVRAIVPDLYFWKSAKWITGVRFVKRDQPGYWERRGYNNHGDPWREERYS